MNQRREPDGIERLGHVVDAASSRPCARSRSSARAVRNTIGISLVLVGLQRLEDLPVHPAIITSRRITSGLSERASSTPTEPSSASMTSIPEHRG